MRLRAYLKKYSLPEYLFILMVSFSGFFLANITKFSPVYFAACLFALGTFVMLFLGRRYYYNSETKSCAMLIVIIDMYLVLQMVITNSCNELKNYLLYIFSISYLLLVLVNYKNASRRVINASIKGYFYITSIVLVLDLIIRIIRITIIYKGSQYFYNYKYNGIMFQDSNFSGFLSLINISFMYYLKGTKKAKISKAEFILQSIILITSLSRSAIITLFIITIWFEFKKNKQIRIVYFALFSLVCALVVIVFTFNKISDDSLLSKFAIFSNTTSYIAHANVLQILFGNGLLSSVGILGFSGHNYISNTLIEFGLLALILIIINILYLLKITKGSFLYILLPYLIAGLSAAPTTIPYFFTMAGLIYLLEKDNNE